MIVFSEHSLRPDLRKQLVLPLNQNLFGTGEYARKCTMFLNHRQLSFEIHDWHKLGLCFKRNCVSFEMRFSNRTQTGFYRSGVDSVIRFSHRG